MNMAVPAKPYLRGDNYNHSIKEKHHHSNNNNNNIKRRRGFTFKGPFARCRRIMKS